MKKSGLADETRLKPPNESANLEEKLKCRRVRMLKSARVVASNFSMSTLEL